MSGPPLPNELTCLIIEHATRDFLFDERTWVLSLRLTCRTVHNWLHPLIFADLIVTRTNSASFLLLLDAVEPTFFSCTRSVNLLLHHANLSVDFFTQPKFVMAFKHVRRWYCSLRIMQHIASHVQGPEFSPHALGVCDDLWLLMANSNSTVHRALRTVTHLRLMVNVPLGRTALSTAPVLQHVILDVIQVRLVLENVSAVLAMQTVRRVVVLLHVSPGVATRIRSELSAVDDPRLHVVSPYAEGRGIDQPGLLDLYRREIEQGIDHWHAGDEEIHSR